jgi:hypothetical protein
MRNEPLARWSTLAIAGMSACALLFAGCKEAEDALSSDVTGQVLDNRGEPVAGATVRLYSLLDNSDFVEGSDITSAEAYIDREAVLASRNWLATAQTGDDGRCEMGAIPQAFLAVAVKDGCSAGFAGFDEETGVLNVDTLIAPNFEDGLSFEVDAFVLACASPPEVGPEGNGPDAPGFEPPPNAVSCDEETCTAAEGNCDGDRCVIACSAELCEAAGGACEDGVCAMAACDEAACADAGGSCSDDGTSCLLPACNSDADCQAGQPGAFCENPGDVELSECRPPAPGEITPPSAAAGFTGFRVTDLVGNVLADAAEGNRVLDAASTPADGLVRVYGDYAGEATTGYLQVQSGGQHCEGFPPRTDYISFDLLDGKLMTEKGDFLELALHGGYQQLQLSTSDVVGAGERSFVVQVGEPCALPAQPFSATLTWDAGPGEPADLDLNVWNAAGELVFVGSKQAAWGQLKDSKGPGPEVFESSDVTQGPFTIKVQFFSGKPRPLEGKVRILRSVAGEFSDETYVFTINRPKDVIEVGVFTSQ